MRTTRPWWVAIVAVALVAAACGDDGDTSGVLADLAGDGTETADDPGGAADDVGDGDSATDDAGPAGDETALTAAAEAAFEAFVSSDETTWFDTLSRACREDLGFVAVQSHLDGRRFRIEAAGISLGGIGVSEVTVEGFDGRQASVSLVLTGTTEAFVESLPRRWVFEEGSWRLDDCADIEPTGDNLAGFGTESSDPAGLGFVVDADGFLVGLYDINTDNEELVLEIGGVAASQGGRIVTTQLSVDYVGAEASVTLTDELAFTYVSGDTVYGDDTSCAGTGDSWLDPADRLAPGESTLFFTCHEVDPGDLGDLLLRIERIPTGDDWWFALS